MQEIWKPVKGYEGFYEVSNQGRIRSLDRICNSKLGSKRVVKGKVIAGSIGSNHYKRNNLRDSNGVSKTITVHRMVLTAFVGDPPSIRHQACHNDGNKFNNCVDNLRWDTCQANNKDKTKHGTQIIGERNHNAKLSENEVREIRLSKDRTDELSKRFNSCETNIRNIKRGDTWKHI